MTGHDDIFKDVTIKGLLERIEKDDSPEVIHKPNVEHPENYIILLGKKHGSYEYPDILVSKTVEYKGLDWNQCEEKLHQEDSFMLTIRQFADFLKLLREIHMPAWDWNGKYVGEMHIDALDGNGKCIPADERRAIYNEITEVRDPYRAECLDAKFSKQGNDFYINYHEFKNNTLFGISAKLEDCIMSDKQIDLEDWLNTANSRGLPVKATKKGSLYYWVPVDGPVAGLWAFSVRAFLDCDWVPAYASAGLGVRHAKILRK